MTIRYPTLESLIKEGFVIFIKRGSDGFSTSTVLCEEPQLDSNKKDYLAVCEIKSNRVNTAFGALEKKWAKDKEIQVPDGVNIFDNLVQQGAIFFIYYNKEPEEKRPSFKIEVSCMKAPPYRVSSELPLGVTLDRIYSDEDIAKHFKEYGYVL